jgi:hypothetical protein
VRAYSLPLQDGPLAISIGGDRSAVVTLSQRPTSEKPPEEGLAPYLIQVLVEADPPPKAAQALRDRLVAAPAQSEYYDNLPGSLRAFSDLFYGEIADIAMNAFSVMRWRFSMAGPVRPFSNGKLEWSDDSIFWTRVPNRITLRMRAFVTQRPGDSQAAEINRS